MGTEKGKSEVKEIRGLHSYESPVDKPPKTMYKYTSFKRTFDILLNNKIYFAKSLEFNDPFDGPFTLDYSTPESRRAIVKDIEQNAPEKNWLIDEKQKQAFIKNPHHDAFILDARNKFQKEDPAGFCCLTDTCQSMPMWAHYAANHSGCCLVFDFSKHSQKSPKDDFPFYWMKKIKYQKDLPKYSTGRIWHYYAYKSCEWEYEHEWRAVMFGKKTLCRLPPDSFLYRETNGAGLYSLGNFLHGVILGHKMEEAFKEVIKVAARQRGIVVQQASPEVYEYGIRLTEVDNKRSNQA